MKSKVFGFKILFVMLAILTAGLCFGVGVKPTNQKSVAVAQSTKTVLGKDREEFSALFDGNVIFSAEKVRVAKDGDSNTPLGSNSFYYGTFNNNVRQTGEYKFDDIQSSASGKTVIDNGEFVVFENTMENGKFVSGAGQEAVMVSFGGYYFDQRTSEEQIDVNTEEVLRHEWYSSSSNTTGKGARITRLDVHAFKDGKAVDKNKLIIREYLSESIAYYDFVYLIKQDAMNSNEGFYQFTFNYMINGYNHEAGFEFYLINKASFVQSLDASKGYNAEPTLGWKSSDTDKNFPKCSNGGEAALYRLGKVPFIEGGKALSFPTITYDYTKYKLKYTHSANRVSTKWEFDWRAKVGGGAEMVYSSTLRDTTKTGSFDLADYNSEQTINLVTIMLTEPGNYTVEYEAYYSGYNSDIAPVNIGIKPGVLRLNISGLVTKYSKADQSSARLEYFEIVSAKNNQVDVFVPNGYNVDKALNVANEEVGFAYKFKDDSTVRDGFVLKENYISALANDKFKLDNLTSNKSDFVDSVNKTSFGKNVLEKMSNVLSEVSYASTNQASIWISGNNSLTEDKTKTYDNFYIYSPTKPSCAEGEGGKVVSNLFEEEGDTEYKFKSGVLNKFTNETTFNKTGYYLVFVNVDVDSEQDAEKTNDYWQVFAFQYTSTSVNIKVEEIVSKTETGTETQIIEGGSYTNKNVEISWKIPGVFDRDIEASYFMSTNKKLSRDEMLKTPKQEFKNIFRDEDKNVFRVELGESVKEETFVQFLVRLTDEEGVATHKIFTIDRQSISGVKPYLVEELYFGSSVYYAIASDEAGNNRWINNSITDSLATLMWNKKASGAAISATYTYYSFANGAAVGEKGGSITSGWKLGSQATKTFTPVEAEDVINLKSSSVLNNQGVYLFKIVDAAGNGCLFMLVIDKTENYFKITLGNESPKYIRNELVVYGNNVKYDIGKSKLIELNGIGSPSTDMEKLMSDFATNQSLDKLTTSEGFKYYQGADNNYETIKKLFKKIDNAYYLSVENEEVVAYLPTVPSREDKDFPRGITSGELVYNIKPGESSYKRILYAVGKNHVCTTRSDRQLSNVIIEINKDNSRLNVFYGNGTLTEGSARLDTGSDVELGDYQGLKFAKASAMDNIAIAWSEGTGKYEVENVTLTRYTLGFNAHSENGSYFYNAQKESSKSIIKDAQGPNNEGRVIYQLNVKDADGLYVVERTYIDSDGSGDYGEDVKVKNYYFIVDHSQIIDNNIGELIRLELLEDETPFNTFDSAGNEPIEFKYEGLLNRTVPYLYLTTNKVPVTLKVPAGKFDRISNQKVLSSAGYEAGRLNVQIFYLNDEINQQLKGKNDSDYRGGNVKIFDSEQNLDLEGVVKIEDGYIQIDLAACIESSYVKQRLVGDDNSWMFLPGKYVVRIYDNVLVDVNQNTNEKYIGFAVPVGNKGPQGEEYAKIDIRNGYNDQHLSPVKTVVDDSVENGNENGKHYTATVSQECLEILMPRYINEQAEKPMLDPEYLEITQINDGVVDSEYFVYTTRDESKIVKLSEDDKEIYEYGVKLNTLLRDDNGNIIQDNLAKELKYEIKVRYKISDDGAPEKYKNCYVYYDHNDKPVYYYLATITIEIDRKAPVKNIEELNKRDALVEIYVDEHKQDIGTVETMTENKFIDTNSYVHFTHQYSAYYQSEKRDKKYIYAYQVDELTPFDLSDVDVVYRKQISDLSTYNLTLPFASTGYTPVPLEALKNSNNGCTYANLFISQSSGFYEIIEQDKAGNTTQYVVHYMGDDLVNVEIPINCEQTDPELNTMFKFTLDEDQQEVLHLYNIEPSNVKVVHKGYNFIIELFKNSSDDAIYCNLTNPSTNFNNISSELVKKIKDEGYGSYKLVIRARKVIDDSGDNLIEKSYVINLYNKEDTKTISLEGLIENTNEGYKLFFNKAWVKDEEKGLVYYATQITIKSQDLKEEQVFKGEYDYNSNRLIFTLNGVEVSEYIFENKDIVYQITMVDNLKRPPQMHRFSPAGIEFYKVQFENPDSEGDWGDFYYLNDEGEYVGYTSARVVYDKGVFTGYYSNGDSYDSEDKLSSDYNKDETHIISIKDDEGTIEKEYTIRICSNLGNVTLREYSTGEHQEGVLESYDNTAFNNSIVKGNKSLTGIMNLQWDIVKNESLIYEYMLHEQLADGTYRVGEDGSEGVKFTFEDSQRTGNYTINTKSDSSGKYVFEIRVYGAHGKYLGNRLFAFEVQKANDKVYYVRHDAENKAVINNSTFNLKELGIAEDQILNGGMQENLDYPLYIANSSLTIVPVGSLVNKEEVFRNINYPGFTIYKISKQGSGEQESFKLFIAILRVDKISDDVKGVYISAPNINEQVLLNTDYTITNSKDDAVSKDVKLKIDYETVTDDLLKKNKLFLDVYYENQLVDSKELVDNDGDEGSCSYIYNELGNGKFSYVVRDLAGNKFKYRNEKDQINVSVLREVVVTLNDQIPIRNGYYNDSVQMEIVGKENYVPGSLAVNVKFNGEDRAHIGSDYYFDDFGTYRITIKAKYLNHKNEEIQLSKEVVFTILNSKEVARSVDLSCLGKCEIVKVLNNNNVDVTKAFMTMLNSSNEGLNITYDLIMKHSTELGVSVGKLNFVITYKIKDDIYPERTHALAICLNNEEPSIDCTLKSGEKSTKGFTITYNGAILYQQIGEAEIRINGKTVAVIDENSSNSVSKIRKSFKASGAGNYYIQIVSSSGEVWESFRVTIKEPLNTWAIIVIVVVVLVVVAVVVTIIVLRRKMRIR